MMSSKLDRLLETLEPARVLDEVSARVDSAMNAFCPPRAQITDWEQFKACLVAFVTQVESKVLRLARPVRADADLAWGRCARMLIPKYGGSADKTAFEMARTGNEGGLYAVLKTLAGQISQQLAENEIRARVLAFWDGLSVDERLAIADEYLRKYGHLLPSEVTEASAARLRVNMPRVLQEHPRLLREFRQIGR